jgi:hypothetical protein
MLQRMHAVLALVSLVETLNNDWIALTFAVTDGQKTIQLLLDKKVQLGTFGK